MINKVLLQIIKQVGLESKHALIYELLVKRQASTPLELSRETKLNRSSLYRYLEELRGRGLVELVLQDKSSKYRASLAGFDQYLAEQESRVEELKKTIPTLLLELKNREGNKNSEVRYFQGREGLKQMLWNVVASGKPYAGLGYENWNTSVGKTYADKLRVKNMETGAKSREITNDLEDGFEYTELGDKYQRIYEHRVIEPKILEIKHDTYIYGEVFAYYYHYQGEYFGVEIHNQEITRTERQMFEILWGMAKTS